MDPALKEVKLAKPNKDIVVEVSDDPYQADKSSTSSEESSEVSERYVIPQKRNLKEKQKVRTYNRGTYDDDSTDLVPETATPVRISQQDSNSDTYSSESTHDSTNIHHIPVRRGVRQKRPPLWMRTGHWQV